MDIKDIQSSEDFAKLTPEEKHEYIQALMHSEATGVTAAFYNPHTHERVTIEELVAEMGEEAVIAMIEQAMEHAPVETLELSVGDYKELRKKAKTGTLTQKEELALRLLEEQMLLTPQIQFERTFVSMLCELIEYGQYEEDFKAKYINVFASLQAFTFASLQMTDGNPLGPFKNYNIESLRELEEQIGDDILNTWKASCTNEPIPALVLLGLLHAVSKVAHEMDIELPDGKQLCAIMSCNEDADGEENGSNMPPNVCRPATYKAEDEEMRDLLKE